MSIGYDAYNSVKSAAHSTGNRLSDLGSRVKHYISDAYHGNAADGNMPLQPAYVTVDEQVAPVQVAVRRRAGFGTKMTLAALLAVAALGVNSKPAKGDISEFPSTQYEWTLTLNGPAGGGYNWTGLLHNISTGDNSDAGKDITIFAQNLSEPISYLGDLIGDLWTTSLLDINKLVAKSNGANIMPQWIDPSRDELYITFESPFSNTVSSTINISTLEHGIYTIENAQVPGQTTVVPLPGAVFLGAFGLATAALGRKRFNESKK